jgi:hypothetical protein
MRIKNYPSKKYIQSYHRKHPVIEYISIPSWEKWIKEYPHARSLSFYFILEFLKSQKIPQNRFSKSYPFEYIRGVFRDWCNVNSFIISETDLWVDPLTDIPVDIMKHYPFGICEKRFNIIQYINYEDLEYVLKIVGRWYCKKHDDNNNHNKTYFIMKTCKNNSYTIQCNVQNLRQSIKKILNI